MFEHAGEVHAFLQKTFVWNSFCKVIFITMLTRRFEENINLPGSYE